MSRLKKERAPLLCSTRLGPLGSFVGIKDANDGNLQTVLYVPLTNDNISLWGALVGKLPVKEYPYPIFRKQLGAITTIPKSNVSGCVGRVIWVEHDSDNWYLDGLKEHINGQVEKMSQMIDNLQDDKNLLEMQNDKLRAGFSEDNEKLRRENQALRDRVEGV